MEVKKSIAIGIGIVVVNLLLAHFLPPMGLFLTPFALTLATAVLVFNSNNRRLIRKTLTVLGLIIIHDLGLKLFAGGDHDQVGQAWLNLMLVIGLIPSYFITVLRIARNKQATWVEKTISILIFPIIMAGHLYLFDDFGF